MNGNDLTRLVDLLAATWTTGPKAYVWHQALEPLDAAAANRTYADLRTTARTITVAAFLETYERRRVAPAATRRDPSAGCAYCGGTGFEPGPPEYEQVAGEPHEYSTVVPCRCTRPGPPRTAAPTAAPLPFPEQSLTHGDPR